jgi:hypothetical protein
MVQHVTLRLLNSCFMLIARLKAADVPVAQLNVTSDTKSVPQLFDYAFNFMRLELFTIPGKSS